MFAVTRPGPVRLAAVLRDEGACVGVCIAADQGIGAGLAFGVRSTPLAKGWLVALGDMPWVHPDTVRRLVSALTAGADCVAPLDRGRRGHPVGFGRPFAPELEQMGAMLGYDVTVIDNLARADRFPGACYVIDDDVQYRQATAIRGDFAVVATHHKGDDAAIRRPLSTEIEFIALLASRQRARPVLRRLQQEGIDQAALARVRAPAGLAIGARTPQEIALSIAAEMVMLRRSGQGISKRDVASDIEAGAQGPAADFEPPSHSRAEPAASSTPPAGLT